MTASADRWGRHQHAASRATDTGPAQIADAPAADQPDAPTARPAAPDLAVRRALDALDGGGIAWGLEVGDALDRHEADPRMSGDIDLLVAEPALARADERLRDLGWMRLRWRRGPGAGYLRYDADTRSWAWLDLNSRVSAGPLELPPEVVEALLRRRERVDAVWTLSPDDEAWLLALRILADPDPPRDYYQHRLAAIAAGVGPEAGPLETAVAMAGGSLARWHEEIRRRLVAGDVDGLVAHRGLLGATPARPRRRGSVVADIGWRLRQGLDFRRWSPAIALVGPDGAGKTTTAANLAVAFPFPTRRVYMGMTRGWGSSIPSDPRHVPGLSAIVGIALQWRRWLAAAWDRARGRVVIFDRYTEDAWLPSTRRGRRARIGRRLRSMLACPRPDLLVVLDAPASVMFARKGEHDPTTLDVERRRYLALSGRPNVLVVDAARPAADVTADILEALWDRMRAGKA